MYKLIEVFIGCTFKIKRDCDTVVLLSFFF